MQAPESPSSDGLAINPFSCSDMEAVEDSLGFAPYTEALADFLLHPDTEGPLTVSIEGEWGSGKTSFMRQLEARLKQVGRPAHPWWRRWLNHLRRSGRSGNSAPGVETIWFSPWRHDTEESLWAAFAVHFTQTIARGNAPRRLCGHLRLFVRRLRWNECWVEIPGLLIRVGIIGLLGLAAIRYGQAHGVHPVLDLLSKNGKEWGPAEVGNQLGVNASLLLSAFLAMRELVKGLKDILSGGLKRFLDAPNYHDRIAFVERFHHDFARIVRAYAGKRRVFVFIDDLDRCEVPKAADLMKAINLLTATQAPLFFIIGMDRAKVAAGLAVKFQTLLPYIDSRPAQGRSLEEQTASTGLGFGYDYIEKFVQIPFALPQPGLEELRRYLADLGEPPSGKGAKQKQHRQGERDQRDRAAAVVLGRETKEFWLIAEAMGPFLGNNPRRMKQFVNVLRLRAFLAARTGLFDSEMNLDSGSPLRLEQLAKVVVMSLVMPGFVQDLAREPRLLRTLAAGFSRNANPSQDPDGSAHRLATALQGIDQGLAEKWSTCADLERLITFEPEDSTAWAIGALDVKRLLATSPDRFAVGSSTERESPSQGEAARRPKVSIEDAKASPRGFNEGFSDGFRKRPPRTPDPANPEWTDVSPGTPYRNVGDSTSGEPGESST